MVATGLLGSFSKSAGSFFRVLFFVFNLLSFIRTHPNGLGFLSCHCPGISGPWGAASPPPPPGCQLLFTPGARVSILPSGGCDLVFGGRAVTASLLGSGPPRWPAHCWVPETLSSDMRAKLLSCEDETLSAFVTVLAFALMAYTSGGASQCWSWPGSRRCHQPIFLIPDTVKKK